MTSAIQIRPGIGQDHPLVYSSWLQSFRPKNAPSSYWEGQHRTIERLLGRCDLWIACYAEAPSLVLGWACIEHPYSDEPIVHYCYVKKAYRRLGVARSLLAELALPIRYSHRPRSGSCPKPPKGWRYDPFTKD